jgi:cytochrome c oxidase assembly factor CtaG
VTLSDHEKDRVVSGLVLAAFGLLLMIASGLIWGYWEQGPTAPSVHQDRQRGALIALFFGVGVFVVGLLVAFYSWWRSRSAHESRKDD